MTQRSILITGASSGIGLASVRLMKAQGWRVLATARQAADLARLQNDEGVEAISLELASPASSAACSEEAIQRTGGSIYAVFNNAAYGQIGAIEDLSADILRRQIEVNVIGTHELTRRLIPHMRRQGAGRIVQCSSVLGFVTGPYRGAYSASKFALEALSDAMRFELEGSGVQVSIIEPGPIRTRFLETALARFKATVNIEASPHRETYLARLARMEAGGQSTFKLEPEAVARKLLHAVSSSRPRRRYYVTVPTYAAAVMRRIAPPALMDRMSRNI